MNIVIAAKWADPLARRKEKVTCVSCTIRISKMINSFRAPLTVCIRYTEFECETNNNADVRLLHSCKPCMQCGRRFVSPMKNVHISQNVSNPFSFLTHATWRVLYGSEKFLVHCFSTRWHRNVYNILCCIRVQSCIIYTRRVKNNGSKADNQPAV